MSVQYQTQRDLLGVQKPALRKRISTEGWGAAFLAKRGRNGHWGRGFYQPKWTSTHYTLLDLRLLELPPRNNEVQKTIQLLLQNEKGKDGGMNPSRGISESDVCINGMFLNYACYFKTDEDALRSVVDFILSQQLPDGGFNCRYNRSGARHSSLHSTLSVLEGFHEYSAGGYKYRLAEIKKAER